jgi:diguanylate cyclase (GGDEF)-like protein
VTIDSITERSGLDVRKAMDITDSDVPVTVQQRNDVSLGDLMTHDPLTGLANRSLALSRLEHSLQRAKRMGTLVGVFLVDIDDFKRVNVIWDHAAGDAAVLEVARRLDRAVRPADTAGRWGDDEFLVACEDVQSADVEQIARRMIAAIQQPIRLGDDLVHLSASVGICLAASGVDPEAAIAVAESARRDARAAGGSRCRVGSLRAVRTSPRSSSSTTDPDVFVMEWSAFES